MIEILDFLNRLNIKFWTLRDVSSTRDELYMIGNNIESKRRVESKFYVLDLYMNFDEHVGETSVSIPKHLPIEEIKNLIKKAVEDGSSIKNRNYALDQGEFTYTSMDSSLSKNVIRDALDRVKVEEDTHLSSLELFATNTFVEFYNSAGNRYSTKRGEISTEIVLLSKDREMESIVLSRAPNLEILGLDSIIKNESNNILDISRAILPKSGVYRVAFIGELLEELFSYHIFHSLGSSFYKGYSLFKVGEPVGLDITISSDPNHIGLEQTVSDNYGYPIQEFTFIRDGILEKIVADKRYSQYLSVPFTGGVTNAIVSSGNSNPEDVIAQSEIVISKVSCFTPNHITGEFSAEIRLGYIIENGVKTPIRGGSVSGSFKKISNVLLSNDRVHFNSYIGPSVVMLENITISGK